MQFEQLGPYKIGRKLGRGGMGTVYEAVNCETGQPAAIKLLNPHLSDEEGFRERFEVEIETLKKLKHPNIVRLYGFGEHDGEVYYAMELVPGTNLEDELHAGRRFDWRETTGIGVKLCRALKHAHDHGVIHRDIKPANLLLSKTGEIKLTDFGIARLFGNTRMTADGGLVGTAEYMAPEQADGRQVTYHADLYSLGSVLFAMLAGRPPFRSRSLAEMLQMQRCAEPPAVSEFNSDVPRELENIIAKLLSKSPSERVANADLLARQLSAMEHGLSMTLRGEEERNVTTKDGGFSFNSAKTIPDEPAKYDPNAPTRASEEPCPPEMTRDALSGATAAFEPLTLEAADNNVLRIATEKPPAAPIARNRFTTVEEDERRRAAERLRERAPVIAQVLMLLTALITIVAMLWYFMRPPSADQLFEQIELVADDERPDRLLDAADDIQAFMESYPDDPRSVRLAKYQEEIELMRLERRFARRSRQLTRDDSLTPLERDYIEAVNQIGIDPQRTMVELQAIIDFYGSTIDNNSAASETSGQVLQLARRQLARLEKLMREQAPAHLTVIDRALQKAEEERRSDIQAARAIWQSIVTLYGDKPWAASRVARARASLEQSSPSSGIKTP